MIIVFVNPVGAIGGAERVLLTLFAALRNTQPNIQLHLIVGTDGLLVASAQELGVRVRILKLPDQVLQLGDSALKGNNQLRAGLMLLVRIAIALPAFMQYVVKFQKTIGEINPDLIHTNGIKSHLLTRLLGLKRVPVVWHIHDFYSSRPLMARVLRWASDRATGGIAISEAVAQDAIVTLPRLPIE
jgi:glycosyltransferase involved in cell wall biosynthesis